MIEFGIETLDEVLAELKPLLECHYEEVAMYQDHIKLNPDYDRYYAAEELGQLSIYTMRDDDDLVGYSVFFKAMHPHYKDHLYAVNDIVYICEGLRHSPSTIEFFATCEEWLKQEGASVITYHMKVMKQFTALMNVLKFDHAEHLYSKYVG